MKIENTFREIWKKEEERKRERERERGKKGRRGEEEERKKKRERRKLLIPFTLYVVVALFGMTQFIAVEVVCSGILCHHIFRATMCDIAYSL